MGDLHLIYMTVSESLYTAYSTAEILGHPLNNIESRYAPKKLYIRGKIKIPLPGPRVAIVGTRMPTPSGIKIAYEFARRLSKEDIIIISGLARGIDTRAHLGAIEAEGRTIAVLGTPLNYAYPPENSSLQKEIAENHLAISEFPIGEEIQRKNFVIRDRTMALLCDASIIIEAGDGSGTLNQGWEALRLGRPLFIWKSVFEDATLKWPRRMLDYGAIKLETLSQVLDGLVFGEQVITLTV